MRDRGRRRQRGEHERLDVGPRQPQAPPPAPDSPASGGHFLILHAQSPPSVAAGLSPPAIPFGNLEVPAFAAAIEAHQKRITEAIMEYALGIWAGRKVRVYSGFKASYFYDNNVTDMPVVKFAIMGPPFAPSSNSPPVNVETQVVVGDPKEKIGEAVENLHADLLVLGSRASGPFKRMFLGSVSNYCANHVHCPVIIVKAKGAA